ncbi:MAG: DUF4058 family protein [Gemmataceae bacterium]
MIFPGMDPYLEDPVGWQSFHNTFVYVMKQHLKPLLGPRYVARLDARVLIDGPDEDSRIPDVTVLRRRNRPAPTGVTATLDAPAPHRLVAPGTEINESFIEIVDVQSDRRVVTVIELLSPTNKYAGPGRDAYRTKQAEVRASAAHLVEIDLLRFGPSAIACPERVARSVGDYDYVVCVNRAEDVRTSFDVYPIMLRQRLPVVGIPLANGDADARLDLQAVMDHSYDDGDYAELIRYDRPCRPPLPPEDQAWADELIRATRA